MLVLVLPFTQYGSHIGGYVSVTPAEKTHNFKVWPGAVSSFAPDPINGGHLRMVCGPHCTCALAYHAIMQCGDGGRGCLVSFRVDFQREHSVWAAFPARNTITQLRPI